MSTLSLCTGIGGLDLAVGGVTAVAEVDDAASSVLTERFDAPNLGDWTGLESFDDYDVVIGGLPCQPVSGAGKGKGDKDERYLYDDLVRILRAGQLRPALVLENVRGFLYPRHGEHLWRLVSALAGLGYVGRWGTVRASDAGAPHRRERWFCVARHTDRDAAGRDNRRLLGTQEATRRHGGIGDRPTDAAGGPATADADESRPQGPDPARRRDLSTWGDYGPAIARWEHVLGRPAPEPLDGRRLSPRFVEWLMGFDDGWITDLDISRTHQLRCLGNAVVRQQAGLALTLLEEGT